MYIFRLLSFFTSKLWVKSIVAVCCGTLGWLLDRLDIRVLLYFDSALSAIPFFFIGTLLRKLPVLYRSDKDRIYLGISLSLMAGAVWYCWCFGTPHVNFLSNTYKNGGVVEIYIIALVMVIGLLLLCKAVRWLPIVSYLGRYSIIVLGFHIFFKIIIEKYFAVSDVSLLNIEMGTFQIFLLTMLFCWISIPFCKRFVPFFTAQSDLIKRRL